MKYYVNDDLSTSVKVYESFYKKRTKQTLLILQDPQVQNLIANVKVDNIESTTTYVFNDSNILTVGLDYRKEKRIKCYKSPSSSDFITKEEL